MTALVSEKVYQRILAWENRQEIGQEKILPFPEPFPGRPIFIFSDRPELSAVVSGNLDRLNERLLGLDVRSGTFYVPFSNSRSLYDMNQEELLADLVLLGNLDDAESTFQLIPEELLEITEEVFGIAEEESENERVPTLV